jgi:hypothetical protein
MFIQTDEQKTAQGYKSFMMMIDTNPFTDKHDRWCWDNGYKLAYERFYRNNTRKKWHKD